jgi:hypothetical protein
MELLQHLRYAFREPVYLRLKTNNSRGVTRHPCTTSHLNLSSQRDRIWGAEIGQSALDGVGTGFNLARVLRSDSSPKNNQPAIPLNLKQTGQFLKKRSIATKLVQESVFINPLTRG